MISGTRRLPARTENVRVCAGQLGPPPPPPRTPTRPAPECFAASRGGAVDPAIRRFRRFWRSRESPLFRRFRRSGSPKPPRCGDFGDSGRRNREHPPTHPPGDFGDLNNRNRRKSTDSAISATSGTPRRPSPSEQMFATARVSCADAPSPGMVRDSERERPWPGESAISVIPGIVAFPVILATSAI